LTTTITTRLSRGPRAAASTRPAPATPRPRHTADLDIVIPALDEEHRIGETITAICRAVSGAPFSSRVVVVDNGSVDATADTLDAVRCGVPVELISCAEPGKGAAVRAGVLHSNAPVVAYCDADLSTPPSSLLAGMDLVQEGWQAVIGSRRVAGAEVAVPQSLLRRIGSRAFNRAASGIVGSMPDTQCGFKMLDGVLARQVFRRMRLTGYAFDVELIARLIARDARMFELPVTWSNDEGTKLRVVGDGARAFRDLYRVRQVLRSDGLDRSA
jgi:glycosyltransferase involved in cell wall biosynthesis